MSADIRLNFTLGVRKLDEIINIEKEGNSSVNIKLKLNFTLAMEKKFDLEDRLVRFAGDSILFLNGVPKDRAGSNITGQLTRSATSSALNYGEAQGAESNRDKIHKLSVCLKELKESRVALKILKYIQYGEDQKRNNLIDECEQLVAIIASIIKKKKA